MKKIKFSVYKDCILATYPKESRVCNRMVSLKMAKDRPDLFVKFLNRILKNQSELNVSPR